MQLKRFLSGGLAPLSRVRRVGKRLVFAAIGILFLLYFSSSARLTDLQQVKQSGVLKMLTVDGPTTYYEDGRGKNGFEYLLAKAFADSLGVELVVHSKPSLRTMLLSVGGPGGQLRRRQYHCHQTSQRVAAFQSLLYGGDPAPGLSPRLQTPAFTK